MSQSSLKKIQAQVQRLRADQARIRQRLLADFERIEAKIASLEHLITAAVEETAEGQQTMPSQQPASARTSSPLPSLTAPITGDERLSILLAQWTDWADSEDRTRRDNVQDYAGRFKRVLEWFLATHNRPMTVGDLQAPIIAGILEPLEEKARRKYRTATREFIGWLNTLGVVVDRYEVVPVSSPKRDINTAL